MKAFEPSKGDIIIKRATNGFVVLSSARVEGEYDISVYEFREEFAEDVDEAEAMFSLLYEHFPHIFQTKHKGGLSASIHEKGWASADPDKKDEGEV